ncbi:signal peptide peptidase SppA [Buchnera aphidicola]|uniref:Protease 4 n=1 Tax=Buchnera aphidicola (Cinara strobi) TaxID=1921549 RepID=A0A3B1E7U4_9GAMM|nr:signal peptide peptidase SppA [Buchnera aphidicola]VAX76507.1 Protease 4 [Buchnera aphidicola (Cinara strobi)]
MTIFFKAIAKILIWVYKLLKFIREVFFNIILLLIISVFIWIMWGDKKNNFFSDNNNQHGVLVIDLKNVFDEIPMSDISQKINPFNFFNNNDDKKIHISIFEIVKQIQQAEIDPAITGIILKAENCFSCNQVVLEYLGKKLQHFKKSNKPFIAIGDSYSQSEYYLASFADKIFLSKNGTVQINGFSNNKLYFRDLFNICKIHLHVFRIGKYKSAVETFLRNGPSSKAKKIDQSIIQYKWKSFLQTIACNRHITIQDICPNPSVFFHRLKDHYNNYSQYALHYHLIDHIIKKNNIIEHLNNIFKKNKNEKNIHYLDIHQYHIRENIKKISSDKIKIIMANGIIGGDSDDSKNMDIDNVLNEIYYAKNNNDIKAIVLRVNSPGGNVGDSEKIRQKLLELHKCHKPIVISMGEVSASGGYWISTAGDYIIAHPTTITGSIGIFSVIPTIEKLLSTFGINAHRIRSQYFSELSIFHDLSYQDKQKIFLNLSNGYKKFINLVAKSRHKTLKEVHLISQGRVWLGAQAKKIGLVDQIGDIDTAIEKAAELAKIKHYNVMWPKREPTFFKQLKTKMNLSIHSSIKNIFQIFFSKSLVDKIYTFYNNIYIVFNYLKLNKLFVLYLDNYNFI